MSYKIPNFFCVQRAKSGIIDNRRLKVFAEEGSMFRIFVFLTVFSVLLAVSLGAYRFLFPQSRWLCDELGWHDGKGGSLSFDGCSIHSTCSRCGKEVMMDSQGNWF